MSDQIAELNASLVQQREACKRDHVIDSKLSIISEELDDTSELMDTYNDVMVRQLIDTIKIIDREHLLIRFYGGIQHLQSIDPNIRVIRSTR